MNELQNKIKKSSRVMSIISKVMYILTIVGLIVPIGIIIWTYLNPNQDILLINGLKIISMNGQSMTSTGEVIAEMYTIIISGLFYFFIFLYADKIFMAINKSGVPFSTENILKLKRIGIMIMIYSFVLPIARAGFYKTFAPQLNNQISFNISLIILSLLFVFMAIIFEYGTELQKMSDETL